MKGLNLVELPQEILVLLHQLNSPERLVRHLKIVYSVTFEILKRFKNEWNTLNIDEKAILFGAASHDIGKAIEPKELYEKGNKHEKLGRIFLLENGINEDLARFAETHGNWNNENANLEDLIVVLADKIWKGNRIDELEELIAQKLAPILQIDYWEIFSKLDLIINEIIIGADARINWQNSQK